MTNSKYTDLDIDHKKELLVNLKTLYLIAYSLSRATGCDLESVVDEMWREAHSRVSLLSDKDICSSIAAIEKSRKTFKERGSIVIQ